MANLIEIIDSLNDENVSEVKEQLKAEALAKDNRNQQLYARAKKAEGFELRDNKWIKKEQPKTEPTTTTPSPEAKQSDELDYGKLAYLKAEGVDHPDDRKIVLEEAKRLNLPIEAILQEKHIQSQLKDSKDQRNAESGMPEGGSGKSGGNKGSVDYWVNRKDKNGNYETPTDTELANKIIDARVKAEESKAMFSENLHN